MRLSIFPRAKSHPASKKEKNDNTRFVSKPYKPEIISFSTEAELAEIVCSKTWSPFVFKEYRREVDFVSTDVIAFDIDSGMTIEEAEAVIHKLDISCITLPSVSHAPDNHRFRLIFPLAWTIRDKDVFRATYTKLAENFPVDKQCSDLARFYYASRMEDGFWYASKLLEPSRASQKPANSPRIDYDTTAKVLVGVELEELVSALFGEPKEKVPEAIHYFLANAGSGIPGEMYRRGNAFLFTAALMGCKREDILSVFFSLYPYEVTSLVEKKVDIILNDGYNAREEKEEL